jgi:hypothetical protein
LRLHCKQNNFSGTQFARPSALGGGRMKSSGESGERRDCESFHNEVAAPFFW